MLRNGRKLLKFFQNNFEKEKCSRPTTIPLPRPGFSRAKDFNLSTATTELKNPKLHLLQQIGYLILELA